jgi:hypothetical protein
MIPPSCPFAIWEVDILGPFPGAIGGYQFFYVAINKFTKWSEASPVINITQGSVVSFLNSITCRFGVLNHVIVGNGTQFRSRLAQGYYEGISTQLFFESMAHPRSNEQVERANIEIPRRLKTHTYDSLKKHGANWVNELMCVLSGNRTRPSHATGETLFFMFYKAKACLPPKIIMGSPWVQAFDESM